MHDIGFYGAKLSCRMCGIPCQDVGMKDQLSADEAADLVDKSGQYFRANLRKRKAAGILNPQGAWRNPPKPNGIWTIQRSYLVVLAAEYGWTIRKG